MLNLKENINKRLDEEEIDVSRNGGDCSYAYGIEDMMERVRIVIEEELDEAVIKGKILDKFASFLKEKMNDDKDYGYEDILKYIDEFKTNN